MKMKVTVTYLENGDWDKPLYKKYATEQEAEADIKVMEALGYTWLNMCSRI